MLCGNWNPLSFGPSRPSWLFTALLLSPPLAGLELLQTERSEFVIAGVPQNITPLVIDSTNLYLTFTTCKELCIGDSNGEQDLFKALPYGGHSLLGMTENK